MLCRTFTVLASRRSMSHTAIHANLLYNDQCCNSCAIFIDVCMLLANFSGCYFMRDASAACKEVSTSSSDYFSTQRPESGDDLSSFPHRHWPSECESMDAFPRFSYPRCTLSEMPATPMLWPEWFWNDPSQSGAKLVMDFMLKDHTELLANDNQTAKQLGKDLNCNDVQHRTISFIDDNSPQSEIIAPSDQNATGTRVKPNQWDRQNSLQQFNCVFPTLPLELSPVISILRALEVRFHDLLLEFDDTILYVNFASLRLDEALASVIDIMLAISEVESHVKKVLSRLQQGLFRLDKSLIELNETLQDFKLQVLQSLRSNGCLLRELTQTVGVLIQAVEQFNETVPMIHGAMHQLTQLVVQCPTVSASMSAAVTEIDYAIRPYGRFVMLLSKAYQDLDKTIPVLRNVLNFRNALLCLHETILQLSDSLVVHDQVFSPIQQIVAEMMHCHPELSAAKRQLGEALLPHLKYVMNCLESALQPVSMGIQKLVRFLTLPDANTEIWPTAPVLIETPDQSLLFFDYTVPPVFNLNLSGPRVWQNGQPVARSHSNSGLLNFGQTTQQFGQLKPGLCRTALHMNKPVLVIDGIINQFRNELARLGNSLPELDKAITGLEKVVVHFASFKQSTDKAFPKLRITVSKLESVMSEFAANLAPFNEKLVQLNEDRKYLGISSTFKCSPSSFAVYQPIGYERSLGKTLCDVTSCDTSSSGSSVGSDGSSPTAGLGGKRFVFMAKVLVGRYAQGRPDYKQPPLLDCGFPVGKHYDSCVDDSDNPSIFVTFDSDQFYPLYLIEYVTH